MTQGLFPVAQPADGAIYLLLRICFQQSHCNCAQKANGMQEKIMAAVQSPTPPLILIIDDEASVREAVTDILELEGIEVVSAADGASGIALYQELQDRINFILLDLSMPGMSGMETLAQLNAIDPAVRVVLSSGYNQRDIAGRFKDYEITGFIQKPYDLVSLLDAVNRFLA